jgi:hypothetical protein
VKLKNVLPWGRSFDEHREIFDLSDGDLTRTILGCGDGPASFNAELTSRGGKDISVDPMYQFTASELQYRMAKAYKEIMPQANDHIRTLCLTRSQRKFLIASI